MRASSDSCNNAAAYSPDGNWLFFNAQTPGITFAITGPWLTGAL